MIVSKEAFKIIDPIFTEGQVKFKKLLPLVFAIILDMFLLILLYRMFLEKVAAQNMKADLLKLYVKRLQNSVH